MWYNGCRKGEVMGFTADDVKQVIKDAYSLLASGHHTTGALAKDVHGNAVDVDSEAAVSYCEWGAITAATIALGIAEQERALFIDRVNDVLNKANPGPQYDKYAGRTNPQFVTFQYNDSILDTDGVVKRFATALEQFDTLPVDDFMEAPTVKHMKSQHVTISEDW